MHDPIDLQTPLLVGFGVTGQAVARALVARGHRPTVVEDRPSDATRAAAVELGVDVVEAPGEAELADLVEQASILLPSPGVPDHHPIFAAAASAGLGLASEFDLAQRWDDRPIAAITGTNGKTTVTMMVAAALTASGRQAAAVGNTETPFVTSIDDDTTDVFVVEASSFRLAHSARFTPNVAAWLNFAPDHLDAHATLELYEQAKASIWANLQPGATVVANADDPVVVANLPDDDAVTIQTFSVTGQADWSVDRSGPEPILVGPGGPLVAVAELKRRQPHDVANALATAAIALAAGGERRGVVETLRTFAGLPHRLELLGTWDDVSWYNDSKATVPHATVAAVGGFDSVVLIAGGYDKGLSFEPLKETVPPVKGVVAIGDAAPSIEAIYTAVAPVKTATDMGSAIATARAMAEPGDAVLLSPACASFDWYTNYVERGIDFSRRVRNEMAR